MVENSCLNLVFSDTESMSIYPAIKLLILVVLATTNISCQQVIILPILSDLQ